jgi:hypothetical protein
MGYRKRQTILIGRSLSGRPGGGFDFLPFGVKKDRKSVLNPRLFADLRAFLHQLPVNFNADN